MKTIVFSRPWPLMFLITASALLSCKEAKKQKDITEAVKSTTSLIDKNIQADVSGGTVTLKGEVADETTKQAVIAAVKHIEGVKHIESYLNVKAGNKAPQMSARDIEMKRSVDSALAAQHVHGVDITVSNGELTLSGKVTRTQQVAILKIAGEAHASKVSDFLTITDKEK